MVCMPDGMSGVKYEISCSERDPLLPFSEDSPKVARDISKIAALAILPINKGAFTLKDVCQIKESFENRFNNKFLGSFRSWLSRQSWNPWNSLTLHRKLQQLQDEKIKSCFDFSELNEIFKTYHFSSENLIVKRFQQLWDESVSPTLRDFDDTVKSVDDSVSQMNDLIESAKILGVSVTHDRSLDDLQTSFAKEKHKIWSLVPGYDPDNVDQRRELNGFLKKTLTTSQRLLQALTVFRKQLQEAIDREVSEREKQVAVVHSRLSVVSPDTNEVLDKAKQQLQEAKATFLSQSTQVTADALKLAFEDYQNKLLLKMSVGLKRSDALPTTVTRIQELAKKTLFSRTQSTQVAEVHEFKENPNLRLFISKSGQLFLEDLGRRLGQGTFKTVYGAIDIVTGTELAFLHYRAKVKPPVDDSLGSSQDQSLLAGESGSETFDSEVAESEESGSMVVSSMREVDGQSSQQPEFMTKLGTGIVRPQFKEHDVKSVEGTDLQKALGKELDSLGLYDRELKIIEILKDAPGIARTLHIQPIGQDESVLVQMKYQDDFVGITKEGELKTALYASPNDTPIQREKKKLRRMQMMKDAINGLQCMHTRGLIHRDIKPGNIMFCETASGLSEGVISDFGETCSEFNDSAKKICAGTPLLLAPEVACLVDTPTEEAFVTTKADIWSMGLTLMLVLGEYEQDGQLQEYQGNVPLLKNFFRPSIPFIHLDDSIVREVASLNAFRVDAPALKAQRAFTQSVMQLEARSEEKPEADTLVLKMVCGCLQLDPSQRPTAEELLRSMESIIQKQQERIEAMKQSGLA